MKTYWENLVILFEFAMEYKKTVVTILLALIAAGYMTYTRLPPATSCAWKAMVVQSVPYDKWRFNAIPSNWTDQCQYYNGTRWIPLEKVMDVGAGEDMDDIVQ